MRGVSYTVLFVYEYAGYTALFLSTSLCGQMRYLLQYGSYK